MDLSLKIKYGRLRPGKTCKSKFILGSTVNNVTPDELNRIKSSVESGREVLFFKEKGGICSLMQVVKVNQNGCESIELGRSPEFPIFN